jgi:uncharacterized protein (TIGR03086 family)
VYTGLVHAFDSRVQAAPADSWSNAAPCEGWTARDVVVHVGNNLDRLAPASGPGRHRDRPRRRHRRRLERATRHLLHRHQHGDLSTPLPGPFGPMPAEQMIGRLISTDVLVHTWDLARAVGGDEQLDETAVAQAYSGLKPMDAMIRMPGVFGPKIEAAEGDDLQTEFLKFLGRQV